MRKEWFLHKERHWYVAIAKPNCEFKANKNLIEQGFSTIFPTKPDYWFLAPQERRARRFRRPRNRNGGKVAVLGTLIFVGVGKNQSVRAVKETIGVFGMMESASGETVRVPNVVIEELERWIDGDALKEQPVAAQAPKKGEAYILNSLAGTMENLVFEVAKDARGKDVGEFVKGFLRFFGARVEASIPSEFLGERAEIPRKASGRDKQRLSRNSEYA